MHRKDFLCIFTDSTKRVMSSCICGAPSEIEGVIKKLIHPSKKKDQEVFWRIV